MKTTDWRKSSRSGQPEGHWCVEAGRVLDDPAAEVAIRDTKQLGRGPVLTMTRTEFASLLTRIKAH
jgi:hypothetical protein